MSDLTERIFARTIVAGDCRLWLGSICTKGYGQIQVQGRHVLVHRAIYEEFHGPIPAGLVIDHLCHDPAVCTTGRNCIHRRCVNPDHMAAVTNVENLRRQSPAQKRTCVNGHAYDEANTGRTKKGLRYCRACLRESSRRWRARQVNGSVVRSAEVREWARQHGYPVASRGALPQSVLEAWRATA